MPLNREFYTQRLQDRLVVDDRGEGHSPAPTTTVVASEAELLAIPDDVDFVRHAYLYFLKREPDLEGRQYFSAAVLSRGRQSVADELRASAEGSEMAKIMAMAEAPALSDERAEDRRILALGRPLELTELLAVAGDEAFVSALYDQALCRPADPEGFAHHLARLSEGEARESLIRGLAASPEARQTGRPFTWAGQPWPPPSRIERVRRAIWRLLVGESASSANWRVAQGDRVTERLLHHLAAQREKQVETERAVAALQRTVDDDRAGTVAAALSKSLQSLSSDMTRELQHIRAGQAALRAGMDEVVTFARRPAATAPRTVVVAGNNVVASEVHGFIVGVPGEEWRLAAFHAFRGVLEPGLTRRFTESLAPGMTVVDVGANVGMYTLLAARAVAPDGKVYAFEPTPRTFAILKDNIQVNGLLESGRVDCRQMAVSDRRGTARLTVYRDNGGHNTLFPGEHRAEFVDVDTVTLDEALADVRRVDVIKIDAEGAEPLIWSGMSQTLQRNPQVRVFMEFAPSLLRRADQDPGAFLDRLAAAGFRTQRVHDESGVVEDVAREALCAMFSTNLMVTRAAA